MSLTLSPALAALLLRPHSHDAHERKPGLWGSILWYVGLAGRKFNEGFDWLSTQYGRVTARLVRLVAIVLVVYLGLLALTAWRLVDTPSGFIPEQDQGFLIGVVQLPAGASLDRTQAVVLRAKDIIQSTEGVEGTVAFAGLDGSSFAAGARGGFGATGGSSSMGTVAGTQEAASDAGAPAGVPAWAQRMQRKQAFSQGTTMAAHAIRSGDGQGAGSTINLSESNR